MINLAPKSIRFGKDFRISLAVQNHEAAQTDSCPSESLGAQHFFFRLVYENG